VGFDCCFFVSTWLNLISNIMHWCFHAHVTDHVCSYRCMMRRVSSYVPSAISLPPSSAHSSLFLNVFFPSHSLTYSDYWLFHVILLVIYAEKIWFWSSIAQVSVNSSYVYHYQLKPKTMVFSLALHARVVL
jgi:hypothetical protein